MIISQCAGLLVMLAGMFHIVLGCRQALRLHAFDAIAKPMCGLMGEIKID